MGVGGGGWGWYVSRGVFRISLLQDSKQHSLNTRLSVYVHHFNYNWNNKKLEFSFPVSDFLARRLAVGNKRVFFYFFLRSLL